MLKNFYYKFNCFRNSEKIFYNEIFQKYKTFKSFLVKYWQKLFFLNFSKI